LLVYKYSYTFEPVIILKNIFWISFAILVYTYIGYPVMLYIINLIKNIINTQKQPPETYTGSATILIAAYNEKDFILQKLKNIQQLKAPQGGFQIIVVTDGSTDASETIIKYHYPEVMVLHNHVKKGKAAAINRALPYCTGEVIIFSDANTWINPFGLQKMLNHFTHEKVGVVAGEKRIVLGKVKDLALYGESLYWKYESWVKQNESNAHVVIGAAGELLGVRKNLYTILPEELINEDFVLSVSLAKNGWKVVYEPNAYAMEYPSATLQDEMKRKVRIAIGSFQLLKWFMPLLNIFRYPLLGWQYISRKVLRWTICPILLLIVLISNIYIMHLHNFYLLAFIIQCCFYGMALCGYLLAKKGKNVNLFISPFYFVFMHMCQFIGFIRFIQGGNINNWEKIERVGN
jgi:poly-beta-1,6-N-acetyl-D-glucosamine synthase